MRVHAGDTIKVEAVIPVMIIAHVVKGCSNVPA